LGIFAVHLSNPNQLIEVVRWTLKWKPIYSTFYFL
jgi:hypothetical protein